MPFDRSFTSTSAWRLQPNFSILNLAQSIPFLLILSSHVTDSFPLLPTTNVQSTSQHQQGTSYSDTTTFSNGPGGCSITYFDENFQPIPLITSSGTNQTVLQQSGNNGLSFVSAPLQMLPQQATTLGATTTTTTISQQQQPTSIGLDCQYITAEQLHDRFNRIKVSGLKVISLVLKDSNMTTLSNLPQGIHELRKLVISNTSIDLEVLKEGSESLDQLTTLDITNEKISNIPQNFFQEMSSLKELRLENDEIASLDGDAFHNLDDSLEVLDLKRNRFNRFPMAVKNLAQLAVLDLSDNDIVIDTQESDLPEKLEPLLNLRELAMNRINCTCEFSSSPFFEWIARTHISGVRCFAPEKLKHQEVIASERDEFCIRTSGAKLEDYYHLSAIILALCQLVSTIYMIRQALVFSITR